MQVIVDRRMRVSHTGCNRKRKMTSGSILVHRKVRLLVVMLLLLLLETLLLRMLRIMLVRVMRMMVVV